MLESTFGGVHSYAFHNTHNEIIEQSINTWGIGSQIKIHKGMRTVMEVFTGAPCVPGTETSHRPGFRYLFSDTLSNRRNCW